MRKIHAETKKGGDGMGKSRSWCVCGIYSPGQLYSYYKSTCPKRQGGYSHNKISPVARALRDTSLTYHIMGKRKYKRKAKKDRGNNKNWAEGTREELLRPYVEGYGAAMETGWVAERDFRMVVCNVYHAKIPWRLEDHEEPPLPLPEYDPLKPVVEELSAEEEVQKRERILVLNEVSPFDSHPFELYA